MLFSTRTVATRGRELAICAAALLCGATTASPAAADELIDIPVFRKGLWRFERTLEYPDHSFVVRQQAMTRCVDPTWAMQGTFTSPDVGACRSERAERADNRYTFANRCDYLGPVRTEITVHGDDAYTETNTLKTGNFTQTDRVTAQRIGDCEEQVIASGGEHPAGVAGGDASARRRAD